MKAIWNGKVVAESEATVVVEGNHYFPPAALKTEYFKDSDRHTVCPWKGTASYKDVVVDGKVSDGGAWYSPTPSRRPTTSAATSLSGGGSPSSPDQARAPAWPKL